MAFDDPFVDLGAAPIGFAAGEMTWEDAGPAPLTGAGLQREATAR